MPWGRSWWWGHGTNVLGDVVAILDVTEVGTIVRLVSAPPYASACVRVVHFGSLKNAFVWCTLCDDIASII